jgi:SnoaL-like domain
MSDVADRLEIMEVLYKYGQALDHDPSLWDQVFAADAVLDYPTRDADRQVRNDVRQIKTAAEMGADLARPFHAQGTVGQHLVSNFLIKVSGDTATAKSEARVLVSIPIGASGNTEITDRIVTFDDELARTADGWRITRRYLTVRYHDTRVQFIHRP